MKKAIDCALRHIKIFRNQAIKEETADFGEPCQGCIYVNDCNFNWLSVLYPLTKQSSIKISMAVQEPIQPQDKTRNETAQGMDIPYHMDNKSE